MRRGRKPLAWCSPRITCTPRPSESATTCCRFRGCRSPLRPRRTRTEPAAAGARHGPRRGLRHLGGCASAYAGGAPFPGRRAHPRVALRPAFTKPKAACRTAAASEAAPCASTGCRPAHRRGASRSGKLRPSIRAATSARDSSCNSRPPRRFTSTRRGGTRATAWAIRRLAESERTDLLAFRALADRLVPSTVGFLRGSLWQDNGRSVGPERSFQRLVARAGYAQEIRVGPGDTLAFEIVAGCGQALGGSAHVEPLLRRQQRDQFLYEGVSPGRCSTCRAARSSAASARARRPGRRRREQLLASQPHARGPDSRSLAPLTPDVPDECP